MKITATVVPGVQIGAKFGIATANLLLDELPEIEEGVYLVNVEIRKKKEERRKKGEDVRTRDLSSKALVDPGFEVPGEELKGLFHFGPRKTFGGDFSAEVHILDFEQDIYGQKITIELGPKLREVQAFRNADVLFTQIETDIQVARKHFLRSDIRAQWKGLSLSDQQQLATVALKHLSANAAFLESSTVFAYAPQLGREVGFVAALMQEFPKKTYAFPRIEGGEMKFYAVGEYSELQPGKFGILEPAKSKTQVPSSKDLMLVPSVAVTRNGERLGQGGGFYDKYLAKHKVKTLAVVPHFGVVEKLPVEKHDQVLDGVVVCEL